MNRLLITILILAIFLVSCGSDEPSLPDSAVSEDTLVEMLIDIHIIESGLSQLHQLKADSIQILSVKLYKQLFKKYNITQQRFEETAKFYTTNPGIFERAYSKSFNRLVKLQSENKHLK